MGNKIQPFPSLRCIAGITVFSSLLSKENKISALANLGCFQVKKMPGRVTKTLLKSLRQNLTTKTHDHRKQGHFCNCRGTNTHLPLTRDAQPSGQLSLYLLNYLNSL